MAARSASAAAAAAPLGVVMLAGAAAAWGSTVRTISNRSPRVTWTARTSSFVTRPRVITGARCCSSRRANAQRRAASSNAEPGKTASHRTSQHSTIHTNMKGSANGSNGSASSAKPRRRVIGMGRGNTIRESSSGPRRT
ncbi:hypothetical protein Vretifemale_2486 [Volvox reticuliferus]|nr:hypothetical protein Vretifemale_2486 [Volvox reticuliferus]